MQFSGSGKKGRTLLSAGLLMSAVFAFLPPGDSNITRTRDDITSLRRTPADLWRIVPNGESDPLKATPQELRNLSACEDDGRPLPRVTAESAAELAHYLSERSAFIVVDGNTGVDINKPLTPQPYQEARAGTYGGSGFFCRANGQLITNLHVVERAVVYGSDIRVKLADGSEYFARVLASDPRRDVALLQLQDTGGRTFKTLRLVENSDNLRQGDALAAYGNPRFLEGTFSVGHLSALNRLGLKAGMDFSESRVDESVPKHQMTTPIAPGNSGGPVTTMRGLAAGITQSYRNEPGNMNFMIPANAIADFMTVYTHNRPLDGMVFGTATHNTPYDHFTRLIHTQRQNHYIARQALLHAEQRRDRFRAGQPDDDLKNLPRNEANRKLNTELRTARERVRDFETALNEMQTVYTAAAASVGNNRVEGGLIVTSTSDNSLAARSGLKVHDVITHVNGQPVRTNEEYISRLKSMYAYQSFELGFYRNGQFQRISVNPQPQPATNP